MARKSTRRPFGALEARKNKDTGKTTSWRARYVGPDLERHFNVFGDVMAAEAWLNDERILIDRGEWKPPKVREYEARLAAQRSLALGEWAERSIANKKLRPSTRYRYEYNLEKRLMPDLGHIPLSELTRLDVTNWYTKLAARLAADAEKRGRGDGRGALYAAYQVLLGTERRR